MAGMETTLSATELLSRLSAEDIRRRLSELDAEHRALKTLLRAAVRARSGRRQLAVQGEEAARAWSPPAHIRVHRRPIRRGHRGTGNAGTRNRRGVSRAGFRFRRSAPPILAIPSMQRSERKPLP